MIRYFRNLMMLSAIGCVLAPQLSRAQSLDLTGLWTDNTSAARYRLRQIGSTLYWASPEAGPQRNVFVGTISGSSISGEWADLPGSPMLGGGHITFVIESKDKFVKTGNVPCCYGASVWTRVGSTPAPPPGSPAPPPPTASGPLTGTWSLTTTCGYASDHSNWGGTVTLTEGAGGRLSAAVKDNIGAAVDGRDPKDIHSGSTIQLIMWPGGWVSNLQLNGAVCTSNRIDGTVTHYGKVDCPFTMQRGAGVPACAGGVGGGGAGGGPCANPKEQRVMDQWLSQAIPPQPAGSSLRYESWGRLVGRTPTNVITVNGPPDTNLSRCDYLLRLAPQLNSTNLGTLADYLKTHM